MELLTQISYQEKEEEKNYTSQCSNAPFHKKEKTQTPTIYLKFTRPSLLSSKPFFVCGPLWVTSRQLPIQ